MIRTSWSQTIFVGSVAKTPLHSIVSSVLQITVGRSLMFAPGTLQYADVSDSGDLGCCAILDIRQKCLLNPNLIKSGLLITYYSITTRLSWNSAQKTAVILTCSVQNFMTVRPRKRKLWTNEISRYLSFRWVLDGYPILQLPRGMNYI